jgi:hypothetical protein
VGVGADGEEALEGFGLAGGSSAVVVEAGGGDMKGLDDGGGGDSGVVDGGGGRDDGDGFYGVAGGLGGDGVEFKWQDLLDGEVLRAEDSVEALEGEGTLAVDEIRYVRLLEARLAGELGTGEGAGFDAALELLAEELVQILKIHEGTPSG